MDGVAGLRVGELDAVEFFLGLIELLFAFLELGGPILGAIDIEPGVGAASFAGHVFKGDAGLFDVVDQLRAERLERVDGGNPGLVGHGGAAGNAGC